MTWSVLILDDLASSPTGLSNGLLWSNHRKIIFRHFSLTKIRYWVCSSAYIGLWTNIHNSQICQEIRKIPLPQFKQKICSKYTEQQRRLSSKSGILYAHIYFSTQKKCKNWVWILQPSTSMLKQCTVNMDTVIGVKWLELACWEWVEYVECSEPALYTANGTRLYALAQLTQEQAENTVRYTFSLYLL